MGKDLRDLGFSGDEIIRQVGGTWAKERCDKCSDRSYYMRATGKSVRHCIGCLEETDDCSCEAVSS